jgi:hypothetical protein
MARSLSVLAVASFSVLALVSFSMLALASFFGLLPGDLQRAGPRGLSLSR